MAVFSIIKKSELEGSLRLDAEYYKPEYLVTLEKIKSFTSGFKKLPYFLSRVVVTGSTPKKRSCRNDGTDIKFIKTDTLREGQIIFEEADFLPLQESRKNSEPKNGDILVTIIGATHDIVGRVARVFSDDPKININQNIALLRPNQLSFSSYISVLLQTKYGRGQLWQQSRQTEQVNLNCREIENILVPLPKDNFIADIDNLVIESHDLIRQSKNLYSQAENLLLEELGLKDFQAESKLYSIVNLSELKSANRMDAEYFQSHYDGVLNLKIDKKRLSEISDRVTEKIKLNLNLEYKYTEIGDIDIGSGEASFNLKQGKDLPANAKIGISGGELIISKVRPTRGAIAIVPEDWKDNHVVSGAFSVIKASSPLREYMQVVLRSIVGKLQMEKPTTGSSYPTIDDSDVENLLIPILPKATQQKIADLVRKSHEARKKSKELLEEAKRKVEEMIENSNN